MSPETSRTGAGGGVGTLWVLPVAVMVLATPWFLPWVSRLVMPLLAP